MFTIILTCLGMRFKAIALPLKSLLLYTVVFFYLLLEEGARPYPVFLSAYASLCSNIFLDNSQ